MRVLVAGGSGAIGSEVIRLLKAQGDWVRTLSRNPQKAEALARIVDEVKLADATKDIGDAAEGVDVVVSAMGASVALDFKDRRSYRTTDLGANTLLLDAVKAAGVQRIVYLGAHTVPGILNTRYVAAHEAFVEKLKNSGLGYTVVRPTGVFTALSPIVDLARKPAMALIGDGSAKTNPVHPTCVAEEVLRRLEKGPIDAPIGGPDIITRKQIFELAAQAVGKKARFVRMPPVMFRMGGAFTRLFHPRLGELLEFAAAVSVHEAIAPQIGTRKLDAWFQGIARFQSLGPGTGA